MTSLFSSELSDVLPNEPRSEDDDGEGEHGSSASCGDDDDTTVTLDFTFCSLLYCLKRGLLRCPNLMQLNSIFKMNATNLKLLP